MYQIDFNRPVWVHFIGIGGISMSGLAEVLLERGFKVTGSDMAESELTRKLKERGAVVYTGQCKENIQDGVDVVVYTAAVHEDNPEYVEVVRRGIPMLTRAELLGELMRNYPRAVAVAGTHGKTTTTSMLAEILMAGDTDPTISVGGMLDSIGGNIRVGRSPYFVTEACEYTNSFLSLFPTMGIILNVSADHLDFFKDLNHIRQSFRLFAEKIPAEGQLIISSNIPNYQELTADLPCQIVTVGTDEQDNYRMADLSYDVMARPSFTLYENQNKIGTVELSVPGQHNAWNSLAAIAAARTLGLSFEVIFEGLKKFGGTHRRFEKKGIFQEDVLIVDDYAHHPDEIRATLEAARKCKRDRIVCVFQPHTYTRTKALMDEFAHALSLADEIILAEIYPARETDTLGISSRNLAEKITALGKKVAYFSTFEEIENYLRKNSINGEMLITMGAGDIVKVGENLLSK
ncbi:MAG: UDP-N-acetylmuramate--L-alanine ligase [Clostridiales bacterium]|nr:UDP-N-acetylmuramate--L-alanine ligase [Clostridiales bacterium]